MKQILSEYKFSTICFLDNIFYNSVINFIRNRIPKNQWWLKLRPLIKILAKHRAAYTDEDLYIPIQEIENTELWHEPSRKIAPWQMSSTVEVDEDTNE